MKNMIIARKLCTVLLTQSLAAASLLPCHAKLHNAGTALTEENIAETALLGEQQSDRTPSKSERKEEGYRGLTPLETLETEVFGQKNTTANYEKRLRSLERSLGISSERISYPERIRKIQNALGPGNVIEKPEASDEKMEDCSASLKKAVEEYEAHKLSQARKSFQKILEIDPDNADANFNLGCISEDEDKTEEALQYYKRAIKTRPNDKAVRQAIAELESEISSRNEGNASDSETDLKTSAKRAFKEGNYGKAEQILKDLLAKEPFDAGVHFALAQTLLRRGDRKTAVSELEKACQLSPFNSLFREQLASAKNPEDLPANDQNEDLVQSSSGDTFSRKSLHGRFGLRNPATRALIGAAIGTAIGVGIAALAARGSGSGWGQTMLLTGASCGLAGAALGYSRF